MQSEPATFGVGGGVTIDSTAEGEYEECLVKSRFLQTKPVDFELFESMLLEDGEYFLLGRHLERLSNSAEFFGFRFPEEEIRVGVGTWIRRNLQSGTDALEGWPNRDADFAIENADSVKHDRASIVSVDSSRSVSLSQDDIEGLRLGRCDLSGMRGKRSRNRGLLNIVISIDEQLFTPPVTSGLLAGTFREQLLAEGKIKERVITIKELPECESSF